MVTDARSWKSKADRQGHELELPSGNTALVRRIRPEAFMGSGMIPDAISGIVQRAINTERGLRPKDMGDIMDSPEKLAAALEMFDRTLVYCVVEPPVEPAPACQREGCRTKYTEGGGVHVDPQHKNYHRFEEGRRNDDLLYADMVDMEDKQFIFQWAIGGTADMEQFRQQQESALAAVSGGKDVLDSTEQPAGD